uniref:Uncharacterized protein n=1 Tax=Romanomermis culicivorax TaxID=13658 RepID=A0A915J869_ROMCU
MPNTSNRETSGLVGSFGTGGKACVHTPDAKLKINFHTHNDEIPEHCRICYKFQILNGIVILDNDDGNDSNSRSNSHLYCHCHIRTPSRLSVTTVLLWINLIKV